MQEKLDTKRTMDAIVVLIAAVLVYMALIATKRGTENTENENFNGQMHSILSKLEQRLETLQIQQIDTAQSLTSNMNKLGKPRSVFFAIFVSLS